MDAPVPHALTTVRGDGRAFCRRCGIVPPMGASWLPNCIPPIETALNAAGARIARLTDSGAFKPVDAARLNIT